MSLHPSGTERVEWRVSFLMWPHEYPAAHRVERVTEDEADAREQMEGLNSMLADHEVRPCGYHIWDPKLERRVVRDEEWGSA